MIIAGGREVEDLANAGGPLRCRLFSHEEYAITKWLIVSSKIQYIDLSVSSYDCRFMDLELTIDWFFTRHFGIGEGLASTDITVAYTGDDPYRVDYRYSGVLFHLRGSF